mgnify:FL=1
MINKKEEIAMNLLELQDTSLVEKTSLSRKLTLGGITKAYPVYRVRLDLLYYNDQNDRIATWITQYKSDPQNAAFDTLDREQYNKTIEGFIIASNPAAMEKTKNNIALVNQREPGVVLADGRIIDGNRRFTCLRLLHAEEPAFNCFETVILEASVQEDHKQIKMLELAIQHGEEQRVDYNLIDLAIGAYHDIVETGLLTIDEYAESTGMSVSEIKRRLEIAQLIIDFLAFMGVPGQYHVAREMQVFSVFNELVPLLRRCETEQAREELRRSVFNNTMMKTFNDQRKYIRDLKAMMDSGLYSSYIKRQNRIAEELEEKKTEAGITTKKDLDEFVKRNEDTAEDMQISMERSLLQTKKSQARNRPSQIVGKSLSMLKDIDTGVFDKLTPAEREKLQTQLGKLSSAVSLITDDVTDGATPVPEKSIPEAAEATPAPSVVKQLRPAACRPDEPLVYSLNPQRTINTLSFSQQFSMLRYLDSQPSEVHCVVGFVNERNEELCSPQEITISDGEATKVNFALNASVSSLSECWLVIRFAADAPDEVRLKMRFNVKIAFDLEFDF